MPLILNDDELVGDQSSPSTLWHGNNTSYIPGLLALTAMFLVWYACQRGDCQDLIHLRDHLESAHTVLHQVSPELRWRGGLSRPTGANFGTDVQTVNLYITNMQIRSYIMDQMFHVAQLQQDQRTVDEIVTGRQNLVDDMLAIVYQMPESVLEVNGFTLVHKLRAIGLALLSDDCGISEAATVKLNKLIAKLERIDVAATQARGLMTSPGSGMAT